MSSPVRPPGRTTSTGTTLLSGSLPGPIFKIMLIYEGMGSIPEILIIYVCISLD
jgi:hypothetical protein